VEGGHSNSDGGGGGDEGAGAGTSTARPQRYEGVEAGRVETPRENVSARSRLRSELSEFD
jgi:hypothetical protein